MYRLQSSISNSVKVKSTAAAYIQDRGAFNILRGNKCNLVHYISRGTPWSVASDRGGTTWGATCGRPFADPQSDGTEA
ncbi:hypothetical protein EVAR_12075_1 [Eumeta japonica]|uniref:Uncharacterized protein n=1 Tax=Eumeta variegata TaxID=151549 RepID=A0A4C1U673_EUMVA|nr:hypothetical protein EVAR_12075_1 [Eumeta japonica]